VSFAAAGDASLYLVNGVPGRDVAADVNPGFPVDVLLNDEVCTIHGLAFGGTTGPLTLPPAEYDVKVSPANSVAPCTNSPDAETTLKLSGGSSTTLALALNSSSAPTLLTFGDNLSPVKTGEGRITIAHAADAGTLQITLTQAIVKDPKTRTFTLSPGAKISVDLPIGLYTLQGTSGSTTLFVEGGASAENQSVDLVYIVGSASNSSATLITRLIRDVF
jgi:hypothetical protein